MDHPNRSQNIDLGTQQPRGEPRREHWEFGSRQDGHFGGGCMNHQHRSQKITIFDRFQYKALGVRVAVGAHVVNKHMSADGNRLRLGHSGTPVTFNPDAAGSSPYPGLPRRSNVSPWPAWGARSRHRPHGNLVPRSMSVRGRSHTNETTKLGASDAPGIGTGT